MDKSKPVKPRDRRRSAREADAAEGVLSSAEDNAVAGSSSPTEVSDFLEKMKAMTPRHRTERGRLVFGMDATMSRQPTWDLALGLQSDMFGAVGDVGGLDVQLIYFRGAGECRASKWVGDPTALSRLMTTVHCSGGFTQIGKVLSHTRHETSKRRVDALVYVGDCMEEEIDDLCGRAGELALLGVPVFIFQEGHDSAAERAFREIARLTKGAWCRFDSGSAAQLRDLLSAVAVYAAGGRKALEDMRRGSNNAAARLLLEQMTD